MPKNSTLLLFVSHSLVNSPPPDTCLSRLDSPSCDARPEGKQGPTRALLSTKADNQETHKNIFSSDAHAENCAMFCMLQAFTPLRMVDLCVFPPAPLSGTADLCARRPASSFSCGPACCVCSCTGAPPRTRPLLLPHHPQPRQAAPRPGRWLPLFRSGLSHSALAVPRELRAVSPRDRWARPAIRPSTA